MRINLNVDGRSIHDFDNASVERMALAADDDPIWNGFPFSAAAKYTWRAIAVFVLEERKSGRLREGRTVAR